MSGRGANNANEHPLAYTWVMWEHIRAFKPEDYKNAMKEISEFSTVEEFWRFWAYMPRPSEVLYDGYIRKDNQVPRNIDAFSLFKKGIRPEWEDSNNKNASELITTSRFEIAIDGLWENMVLALIGEMIEESDEICGCRVVDKYKKSQSTNKSFFRLELWLKPHCSKELAERVRVRLLEALADGDSSVLPTLPVFEYRVRS